MGGSCIRFHQNSVGSFQQSLHFRAFLYTEASGSHTIQTCATHTHTARANTHTDWQRPFTITRKSNDISKERKEGVEFHRERKQLFFLQTTYYPSMRSFGVCFFLWRGWVVVDALVIFLRQFARHTTQTRGTAVDTVYDNVIMAAPYC
jgi:hypothetical protein